MIAYNHYIKFVPELENDKRVEGSFSNIITVKRSVFKNLFEFINYEMSFFNNQGRDLMLYTDRNFDRIIKGQLLVFDVKDVVTFFWYSGDKKMYYIAEKNFTETLLEYWCLHTVLPLYFTIEEIYIFLHAGAVEIDQKPILFVAESFGGKSTMTDFFMKKGHRMISDDKVGTYEHNGQIFSVASHPHHRPYRKLEDMGYFVKDFSCIPKPIHAIYKLEKSHKHEEVRIVELRGMEKVESIRHASVMNLYFQKRERFNHFIKITKTVPVFKVKIPWDLERINKVYNNIINHLRQFEVQ